MDDDLVSLIPVSSVIDDFPLKWPQTAKRIADQVAALSTETLDQSIVNLHDVEMFFWPGYRADQLLVVQFPLDDAIGESDIHRIMSNRRFLKVLQELSRKPVREASALLGGEIASCLPVYSQLLAEYAHSEADSLRPDAKPKVAAGFKISNNADGTPTLLGLRFKVLALTLVAANLELPHVRPSVLAVAQEARKHLDLFGEKSPYNRTAAVAMLARASLYNRQIVAGALLATDPRSSSAEAFRRDLKIPWRSSRLTHYDAKRTPYDLHVGSEALADYSAGELQVRYLGPVSDAAFLKILEHEVLFEQ